MTYAVYGLAAVLEMILAFTKQDRKTRLIMRAVQTGTVLVLCFLPGGQKWRFYPALAFFALLLVLSFLNRSEKKHLFLHIIAILIMGICMLSGIVFTGYNGLPVSGSYAVREIAAIVIDTERTDPFENDGSSREVPVHFYYPDEEGSYPLVVFSHGAFGYYQSNTSTYMELASNGYIVAALDHPHHAFFTHDTDGKLITVDPEFMNTALNTGSSSVEEDPEGELKLFREWMALRTADIACVLDALEQAEKEGSLNDAWYCDDGHTVQEIINMIDFDAVGLMGHSMGGAAAEALGRQRDDVRAVIDLDGTMLAEYTGVEDGGLTVSEEPYPLPLLDVNNWESYEERQPHLEQGYRYPNVEIVRNSPDAYTFAVKDTKHMDFTDLPLLSPVLGSLLGSGTRDTAETMQIVNTIVKEFLDCYLKGTGSFAVKDVY